MKGWFTIPLPSMYGTFTYIYHILPLKTTFHVGKYTVRPHGWQILPFFRPQIRKGVFRFGSPVATGAQLKHWGSARTTGAHPYQVSLQDFVGGRNPAWPTTNPLREVGRLKSNDLRSGLDAPSKRWCGFLAGFLPTVIFDDSIVEVLDFVGLVGWGSYLWCLRCFFLVQDIQRFVHLCW